MTRMIARLRAINCANGFKSYYEVSAGDGSRDADDEREQRPADDGIGRRPADQCRDDEADGRVSGREQGARRGGSF